VAESVQAVPEAMVMAAADVNPAVTGIEMKSMMKPWKRWGQCNKISGHGYCASFLIGNGDFKYYLRL
jgi:hypothetical protein